MVCFPGGCPSGRDTIQARDGAIDSVRCGPGDGDLAVVDAGDSVFSGTVFPSAPDMCERVDASAAAAGSAPIATAPRVLALSVGKLRRGGRTTVTYRLSAAATVTFTVERRVGRRWSELAGSIRHKGRVGKNTVRFSGKVKKRFLALGRYRIVAVARDQAGNKGPPKRIAFRVIR